MIEIRDEKSFKMIVDEYSDTMYRIALQNLRCVPDAEDVVQDVFVKLLKQKKYVFEDKEHLKAWLIRVTINQCHDYKKAFFRKTEIPLEDDQYQNDDNTESLLDEIAQLPIDDRNIIYLYYYEGYSIKEIAEILRKKQNTVNSRLTRARKKLKTILEEENHEFIQRVNECS